VIFTEEVSGFSRGFLEDNHLNKAIKQAELASFKFVFKEYFSAVVLLSCNTLDNLQQNK
jgi:hypothetical protein